MRPFRSPLFPTFLAALFLANPGSVQILRAESDEISVKVADTATYVKVAKVDLTVDTMTVHDGNLIGTYSIDVPLMKSKSEKGQITLPLSQNLMTYLENGGTISGKGVSEKEIEDKDRKIEARFSPYDSGAKEGRIHLTIETSLRILEFDSTYTLTSESSPQSE